MERQPGPPSERAALHPLLDRLITRDGVRQLTTADFDAFAAAPGHALLLFTEDPVRIRETLDLAVILPEILHAFAGRMRAAVLLPEVARTIAVAYGFRRWPALVMLKDGGYVGAIDGLRNWDEYLAEIARLLEAPVTRPPSVGIAVRGPDGAPGCAA